MRLSNVAAPMDCALAPSNVKVLVCALNVPAALKLPATRWLKDEALNVVPALIAKAPVTSSTPAAVAVAVPFIVNAPAVVRVLAGSVFVPLPLSVRLPYDSVRDGLARAAVVNRRPGSDAAAWCSSRGTCSFRRS